MSIAMLSANPDPYVDRDPATPPVESRHTTLAMGQANATSRSSSSLVELKNGKLVLKQKAFPLERVVATMKELVAFNEMFEGLSAPLETIPPEHLPLIAKLSLESDKTCMGLARKLKTTILPQATIESQDETDVAQEANLPQLVLENAIRSVCERVNYGVDDASAALALWRWEVKDLNMLPPDVQDKAAKRRTEREQAKRDVYDLLRGLADDDKSAVLLAKATIPVREIERTSRDREKENQTPEPKERTAEAARALSSSAEGSKSKSVGRSKKEPDAEQVAAVKDREEKAAVKAEKKRKAGMEQMKAAANMTAWLGKSAAKPRLSTPVSKPSLKSDFDFTFKPFVQKKDTEIAPISKFNGAKTAPIAVDCDGDVDMDQPIHVDENPEHLLRQFLASVPSHRWLPASVPRRRTEAKHCVRDLMAQITEAGVIGDARLVRQLQATLTCGRKIPIKLLQFHDNARPAYFGTWTKSSGFIGPRTPFAKDIASFDYAYDSGDDWNDEGGGDDVISDAGSTGDTPELDSDEDEDEFAGWMVDDDEVEEVALPPSDCDWPMPPPPPPKRKRAASQEPRKKGKFDTPLIAFSRGPYWESSVGVPEYSPFLDYRIQMLNDTPFPLDPFIFVAPDINVENGFAPTPLASQSTAAAAVGPIVPNTLARPTASEQESSAKPRSCNTAPPPKHPFPDSHLRALLEAIEGSTKTRAALTDLLYERFKPEGVKKNAIEAKMKEVCSKQNKVWKVSSHAWTLVGAAPVE